MEESKENAYLSRGCAEECYSNYLSSDLCCIARQTNKLKDWAKVPMLSTLITCFNTDCLMHKDYKCAMENLKAQRIKQHKKRFSQYHKIISICRRRTTL